jgi:chromosome segregation ATPase
VQRCAALVMNPGETAPSVEMQPRAQALERLTWIYLQLLQTRSSIRKTLAESQSGKTKAPETELRERITKLEEQQQTPGLDEGLKKSYSSQLDILRERLNTLQEARGKLDFLEAELVRIQEQVELIREQTMLANEPGQMSDKIDQVTGTLESTSEWIKEQQGIYGKVADILDAPPTVFTAPRGAIKQ